MRPLRAEHPPHLSPCSLMGACTQAVPKTMAGAAAPVLAGLRACHPAGVMPAKRRSAATAATPGALTAGSAGAFRGAATQEGGGWGCAGTVLPGRGWLCRARDTPWAASPWAASPLRALQPAPVAGEAKGRWNGEAAFSGVPKAQETRRRGCLCAGSLAGEPPRPFAFLLRHRCPEAGAGGESRVPWQVFIPVTGAEGMCPWRGGTDAGTPLAALAAIMSPGCEAACPGHRAEGR